MKHTIHLIILCLALGRGAVVKAQPIMTDGLYTATVERGDSVKVPFQFIWDIPNKLPILYLVNGSEKIKISLNQIKYDKDTLRIEMPFFESSFALHLEATNRLKGYWYYRNAKGLQAWNMEAFKSKHRFPKTGAVISSKLSPINLVAGRWSMKIIRPNGTERPALAELKQNGSKITGSILTPSGDYRFLEGVLVNNQLKLSVFDGAHAFLVTAQFDPGTKQLKNGKLYTGFNGVENWTAVYDPKASLPDVGNVPILKPGSKQLSFSFPDLDSVMTAYPQERYKNKVVIVQILGSWCPNCMDETAFLSKFYNDQKSKDVEIIGLAYEYGTDFSRGLKTLKKFKERFQVNYPLLNTGVSVNDPQRTEKTLPQISEIKVFPTTIFIGKDGTIRKMHASFYGPGTGAHHEAFKKEFYEIINALKGE